MAERGLTVRETVDARKVRYGEDDLPGLFADAKTIVACKGKKRLEFDPKKDMAELSKIALGRSGNLRAPTVRIGDKFVVGYSADVWATEFPKS